MEYEIYYLCNILGIALVVLIILFHFVEAEEEIKEDYLIYDKSTNEEPEKTKEKIE